MKQERNKFKLEIASREESAQTTFNWSQEKPKKLQQDILLPNGGTDDVVDASINLFGGSNTSSINPTNDLLFAGVFGLNDKEKKAFRNNQAHLDVSFSAWFESAESR